ncbi:hypothetical protein [Deinococcus wulumuqiensis]|uniref:hypothetical protein n=1 Tax=Deinococcus wulumuqiensis TaxID=980427 RepID=UPI00243316F7|nr:hypothetical protein [Deinococcus wulumuqiensis]
MCKGNVAPAARDGRVVSQLSSQSFQVSVPGVGTVLATDRTGRAQPGRQVTVVQVQGGAWRIA